MSPRIRLVAADLDGTLLRSDRTVSSRTRAALRAAEAGGIVVVLVTGRPLRRARDGFEQIGAHGHAIVSNGALVWDVTAQRPESVRALAPAEVIDICHTVRAAVPGTTYALETLAGIALEPGYVERYDLPAASTRGPLEQILDQPVLKLLARHESLRPDAFHDRVAAALGRRGEITWSSGTTLVDISAPGVTKGSALALLCDGLGIDSAEVVAFGDMPNDVPMLTWAATSFAMGNGHARAIEAASGVAPGNDDDGVAVVLEELLGRAAHPTHRPK